MTTLATPSTANLQTTILTEDNVSHGGLVDSVGSPSSVYTMILRNGDADVRYFAMWDGTSVTWDEETMLIRIQASSDVVVQVDKGASFLTAVTFAASTTSAGLASPTNFDLVMFATPPT